MNFRTFGKEGAPVLMLIPGLGVSYEIFMPLVNLLKDRFSIVAVEVDGFTIGVHTEFTSIDDQAKQIIEYIKSNHSGTICCSYGLSLGGKILSRVLERNEVAIEHSILDAAPLLPLPIWLVGHSDTFRQAMSGAALIGPDFGDGYSTHTTLMSFLMNVGKYFHTAAPKQCSMAISPYIRTD